MNKLRQHTHSLKTRLVLSHVAVSIVSLNATSVLVALLAPHFINNPNPRKLGLGRGALILSAVEQSLWYGLAAGLITAILLGFFASRRLSSSITDIRNATARIATGDYNAQVPPSSTTELEQLSADIRHMSAMLAETEQRRTRLIGEVSHEMRTPLTIIDAQVEAMLDGVLPVTDENIEAIGIETRRLRRLAEDFSALSRTEEGRLDLNFEPVNVSQLVSDVAHRLQPQMIDAGVLLEVSAPEPIFITADEDRIAQVLTNLIGNAIAATTNGDSIAVSAVADTKDGQPVVRIEVTDTGEGISADDVEKVFERFYRIRRKADGGSGIGLPLSRKLVHMHDGTLVATSPGLGQGATFTVILPQAHAD